MSDKKINADTAMKEFKDLNAEIRTLKDKNRELTTDLRIKAAACIHLIQVIDSMENRIDLLERQLAEMEMQQLNSLEIQ